MPTCPDNPASALEALTAQLIEHLARGWTGDRRRQLLHNVKQAALAAPRSTISDQTVPSRSAARCGGELPNPVTSIGDQKRLSLASPLRVAAQILPHLANANELHVRHCSALVRGHYRGRKPAASAFLGLLQLRLRLLQPSLNVGVGVGAQPRDKRRETGAARLERFGERQDLLAGMSGDVADALSQAAHQC